MNREHPNRPVAAVGAVVVRGNEVLLVKRAHPPNQGLWTLPGGGIELGETAAAAVRRELLEECHIVVEVDRVLDVVDIIRKSEQDKVQFHYVILEFLARYVEGNLKPDSDAADARWVNADDIQEYGATPATARLIRMAFSPQSA